MTSTIYETDGGWATGRSRQIADTDGCPQGWVRASAPPEPPDGHRSHWAVTGWAYEPIDQPAPPPTPEPVPQAVTMRQARLALLSAGMLDKVATAIASLPSPMREAAQIEWEYSTEVQREKAFVKSLGGALGLTGAQLDALFINASRL